jgi:hypothetical protein
VSAAAIVIIRPNALTGNTETVVYNPYSLSQRSLSDLVGKAQQMIEDNNHTTCSTVTNASI